MTIRRIPMRSATAVDISIGKNSTVSLSGSPSISLMAKTNSAAAIELTGLAGSGRVDHTAADRG